MKEEKVCIKEGALYCLILWRTYTAYHVIILPKNLSLARATIWQDNCQNITGEKNKCKQIILGNTNHRYLKFGLI